jgi:hypothetical protein
VTGRARRAEQRTLTRLDDGLEHIAASAGGIVFTSRSAYAETGRGVETDEMSPWRQSALRNESKAAPALVDDPIRLIDPFPCAGVAFRPYGAAVLYLHAKLGTDDLIETPGNSVEHIDGVETRDNGRTRAVLRQEPVRMAADDDRHVSRTEKRVHC